MELSLALSAPGTVIVADNMVRDGHVLNPDGEVASARGLRRFLQEMGAEPRLDAVALPAVGATGYNGLSFADRTSDLVRQLVMDNDTGGPGDAVRFCSTCF